MRHNRKIIFIGGVGRADQFGGELTKNKYILDKMATLGYELSIIDVNKCRHSLFRLLSVVCRFIYYCIIYRKATFVFSTSPVNAYRFLQLIYYFGLKRKIVLWVIGGNFGANVCNGRYKAKFFRGLHRIIVEGEKMKCQLADAGLNNVMVMPNFKKIGPLPSAKKYDDGKIHFLFISRIMPQKGADYILQCAKRLDESGRSDRYVIDFYGTIDSEYASSYKKQLELLPNVNYCGSLDLRDWNNYGVLSRYHFMLFPTYWRGEGFPGVVIDAYIAGVPIIASDWNFNSEFVDHGHTGIVIPTHNVEELYRTMCDVIDNDYDIEAMTVKCRDMLPRYDVDNILNQDLFEKIL